MPIGNDPVEFLKDAISQINENFKLWAARFDEKLDGLQASSSETARKLENHAVRLCNIDERLKVIEQVKTDVEKLKGIMDRTSNLPEEVQKISREVDRHTVILNVFLWVSGGVASGVTIYVLGQLLPKLFGALAGTP
jgi:DNA repair ATPase RecN